MSTVISKKLACSFGLLSLLVLYESDPLPIIVLCNPCDSMLSHLVYFLQEVKYCARTPCLCMTRVAAVLAILVGQLWDTGPRIFLYVLASWKQDVMQVVQSILVVLREVSSRAHTNESIAPHHLIDASEVEVRAQEKAQWPTPFGTLSIMIRRLYKSSVLFVHCGSSVLWRWRHPLSRSSCHRWGGTANR